MLHPRFSGRPFEEQRQVLDDIVRTEPVQVTILEPSALRVRQSRPR